MGVSRDCPTEGPKTKDHSWCYCYAENQTSRSLREHGNASWAGTNSDRITSNAMGAVLDESLRNITDVIRAAGLWSQTLVVFSGFWMLSLLVMLWGLFRQ